MIHCFKYFVSYLLYMRQIRDNERKYPIENSMIRFRLKELMADKAFREEKRITLEDVSAETGVHRTTLSRIANKVGYSTSTDVLDALCEYFDCEVGDIAERVRTQESTDD